MFYGDEIKDVRQFFFSSWKKYHQKHPLAPLEQQIVAVILDHPEYHAFLDDVNSQEKMYCPEMGDSNPFLHMGLHLAIREQIDTDRPAGVLNIYKSLLEKKHNQRVVEHAMMEGLAECLWQAQKEQVFPDENNYLLTLTRLLHE